MKNKRIKNRKKGSSAIEFVVGLLIFVLLMGFFVDMFLITNKQYTVAKQANVITRQLSVQGGVQQAMPPGYSGTNETYVNSRELYYNIRATLDGAGIETEEYSVTLTSYDENGSIKEKIPLSPSTSFLVDYQDRFDIRIDYSYEWTITGQLVPGMGNERQSNQVRSSVSEYDYGIALDTTTMEGGTLWNSTFNV